MEAGGWGRGRAARPAGMWLSFGEPWQPGCALRRDDGELLEFPAAGARGRSGERAERAVREGAPLGATLGGASAARAAGGDRLICLHTAGEEAAHLPSPAAPFGSGRGPVPPSRPGRQRGARCRRRPSPSRLVSLSPVTSSRSRELGGLLREGAGGGAGIGGQPGPAR